MRTARLLFPALRWNDETRFDHEAALIDAAVKRGVGGFVLFGGVAGAVRDLTAELRSRSAVPLLIAADLERGAGQQFKGATQLPPLAAIGHLDDLGVTRQAASLTARESLALGVDWVLAPVADLDIEPDNPIVGTRAFGADPTRVAAHVTAWIEGCRAEGARCCAKHFPGHGRTRDDSHEKRPEVRATRAELQTDLTPFRAAVLAGADSIMTAHVSYPALDPGGAPATASAAIIDGLLRRELKFEGVIVTDALIMKGILGEGQDRAVVDAVAAGCDVLLYPPDLAAADAAIAAAIDVSIPRARAASALGRIGALSAFKRPQPATFGRTADVAWSMAVAERSIHVVRGEVDCPREFDLVTIDDDLGGPYPPPSRQPFVTALRDAGFDPRTVEDVDGQRATVVAVYADIRGWKGRPGLSATSTARLAAIIEKRADAQVILFGHPRLAAKAPGRTIVAAWGGETVMQKAAARWLAGETTPMTAA